MRTQLGRVEGGEMGKADPGQMVGTIRHSRQQPAEIPMIKAGYAITDTWTFWKAHAS